MSDSRSDQDPCESLLSAKVTGVGPGTTGASTRTGTESRGEAQLTGDRVGRSGQKKTQGQKLSPRDYFQKTAKGLGAAKESMKEGERSVREPIQSELIEVIKTVRYGWNGGRASGKHGHGHREWHEVAKRWDAAENTQQKDELFQEILRKRTTRYQTGDGVNTQCPENKVPRRRKHKSEDRAITAKKQGRAATPNPTSTTGEGER